MELAEWRSWWERTGARELRGLLMEHWDPIGVAGIAGAEDEYDDYGGHIARMLRESTSAAEIASYLRRVRIDWMELGESPGYDERESDVAGRIIAWYEGATHRD